MSRRAESIQLVIHSPTTPDGKQSLSQQIAAAHAEAASQYIRRLDCPGAQKTQLVDSILDSHR